MLKEDSLTNNNQADEAKDANEAEYALNIKRLNGQ